MSGRIFADSARRTECHHFSKRIESVDWSQASSNATNGTVGAGIGRSTAALCFGGSMPSRMFFLYVLHFVILDLAVGVCE